MEAELAMVGEVSASSLVDSGGCPEGPICFAVLNLKSGTMGIRQSCLPETTEYRMHRECIALAWETSPYWPMFFASQDSISLYCLECFFLKREHYKALAKIMTRP